MVTLHSFEKLRLALMLPSFYCRFLLQSPDSLRYSTWFLCILTDSFLESYMSILHHWISPSSYFTSPSRMDSYSKQCTKCRAIYRTVLPRGEYSDNAKPLSFSFSIHRPIFLLGPCTLKWSLLLLYYGISSSGFCFFFGHLWRNIPRKDSYWLSWSYSLAKYNIWTCDLLAISTRAFPLISSIFSASLMIWHYPLNVNMLPLCHDLTGKISALVEYSYCSGCPTGPV